MSSDVPPGGTALPRVGRGEHPPAGFLVRNRYRIIGELGVGSFGTVSVAEDESTGHRVAVRFFPRRLSQASEAAHTVLRMGRSIVASSSTHPALTRVLEFGEIDSRPFAIMECVEGRRLSELTSKGKPLDLATAMRLALDLGGGLETLHNMGFVHGAVCPRNIVVLADGRLKLLDIELAGLRDARELQGVIAAAPPAEYLAPEQISRAPVDEKADTYAFGTVLHELLWGVPPFQDATREGVLVKHLKEAPAPIHPRRRDTPRLVERAIMLALGKRPESRPLLGDLLNMLWVAAHGPASGRRRIAGIVAAAALAAVAGAAVTWGVLALWSPALFTPTARPTSEPLPPLTAPPAPPAPAPEVHPLSVITPTPPAPSPRPVERAPAISPAPSPAPVVPRPAPASPPPVAPPSAARAPAPASPTPPRVQRPEPTRTPPATTASPARPPAALDSDDPGAVIDWLLKPSSRP